MADLSVSSAGVMGVHLDLHNEPERIPGVKACESLWRRRTLSMALKDYPPCQHLVSSSSRTFLLQCSTGSGHPAASALGKQSIGPVSPWK